MAQVCAARGDYDTVTHLLGQGEALYRHGFYPDVRPIAALKARIQIAAGDLSSAGAWAEDRGISVDEKPDYLREYEHLSLARLLLAQHRAGQPVNGAAGASPAEVLDLLDRLHAAAVQARRDGSVLEIRVLQALAQHAWGGLPEALAALSRSFDTPEPESYVRLYLDEGAPMLALLQHAAGSADPVVQARSRRLLEHATASVEATVEPHQTLDGGPLSDRELQVLRLLDSELTGPEIARELYVTLNTLRTHTKRIFTKLDVTTRAAAVRRAHERGLL
jgi:LuxR family maltose regulon positive regulatory protein